MNSIDQIKEATNLRDVAKIIGFKSKALAYLLYKLPEATRYTKFSIPKSSGGTREILAPIDPLKLAQHRLAQHLQNCLHDIEAELVAETGCIISHGFKRKLSIATNAGNHLGRRWVFNLDLEDFFPSINFGRVRGFLIKNKHFDLHPSAATIIAQISCHENTLPQGAPTSPVISNLITGLLDIRLNKLASRNRCSYTRYADDITFSTNLAKFPTSIARKNGSGQWEVAGRLAKQIKSSGFRINKSKTRMQYRRSRQDVTGLVVNSEMGVKRESIKRVRAQVNSVIRTGTCHVKKKVKGKTVSEPVSPDALKGQLSYIAWVKGRKVDYKRGSSGCWRSEPGFVRTYREFLDHQTFVSSPVPVVVCEGKTDNIYLQCSIKTVAKAPARLIDKTSNTGLGVRLFNFTNTSSWIQRLGGGTGDLKNLIAEYEKRMKQIHAKKFRSPVILVVDNDAGACNSGLNSLVKKKSGSKSEVDGSKDFYHVGLNLYVVYTPVNDTMIEDFLPTAVREQKIGEKTLELDRNKFDHKKNFGKMLLANNIVRRQKYKINFYGYIPILVRVSEAIKHFEKSN